jgi:hypothetical protein
MTEVKLKQIDKGLYVIDQEIPEVSLAVKTLMLAIMSGKLTKEEEKECREKMTQLITNNLV